MREQWVDIAKGITIIAIVIWHMQYNYPYIEWLPIHNLLAGVWPVPVFFILGDFFLSDEKLLDTKNFIRKKIVTLYLPTVYLYIIAILLHNWFIHIRFYDVTMDYDGFVTTYTTIDYIKNIAASIFFAGRELILSPMWFAYVLFVALCLMAIESYIIKKITNNKKQYNILQFVAFFLPAIAFILLMNIHPITIPRYNQLFKAIWLVYVGMLIRQTWKMDFQNRIIFIASIITVYVFTIIQRYTKDELLLFTLAIVAACYALCYISKKN